MAKKSKWYVVWEGRETGVFPSWDECQAQTNGYKGAKFMSFPSREAAERAYKAGYEATQASANEPRPLDEALLRQIGDSYSVDTACSGNPGDLEYQGVNNQTGEVIFHKGPYKDGTNNVGEFLAIVHILALFKKKGIDVPIYSDSQIAMGWVRDKLCKTTLKEKGNNIELLSLINRAETWLRTNEYRNPILKWETEEWGEIPADFGRKK